MGDFATLVTDLSLPEGPRWHQGRLWFSDMHEKRVLAVDQAGRVDLVAEVPHQPSGLGFLPGGELLIVSMLDRRILCYDRGDLSQYADLSTAVAGLCNDMVVDSEGRAYVGGIGPEMADGSRRGSVVLIDTDRTARVMAEQIDGPNGMVITPDGATLVIAETLGERLTAWDRGPDGHQAKRRTWAELKGTPPDGLTLDTSGAIWVAGHRTGQFLRVKEGGEVLERKGVGNRMALSCTLGGPDRRTLFVTTGVSRADSEAGTRAGAVEFATVDVPGAGWP